MNDRVPTARGWHRSRAAFLPLVAAAVLSAGCTLFPDSPGRVWYQLEDARAALRGKAQVEAHASAAAAATDLTLIIAPLQANVLYDGTGIVYGRESGLRSTYQYANWTVRPSQRLVELVDARLNARAPVLRRFATVATETSGVKADWVLGLRIVEFFHDTSSDPDRAIVDVDAELLDWRAKSLVDRRRFRIERPLPAEDVEGAVNALSDATSTLLDRLVAWLDAHAAREARHPLDLR